MSRINAGRVLIGGLLVGLLLNISEMILHRAVLAPQWRLFREKTFGASETAGMVLALFLLGIATVWVYAALRPRFGPGVKTAVVTGITVWVFVSLFPSIQALALDYLPASIVWTTLLWRLVIFPIVIHAGAAPYSEPRPGQEQEQPAAQEPPR